jgi:hypothetical protein
MKLLMSVFLTPDYITKYRTAAITRKSQSAFDRIDKFFSMIDSISIFDWESVDFYLSMDPTWEKFRPSIVKELNDVYPNRVLGERLSLISEWRNATENFSAEDIVLLQSNDDHVLIPNSESYLSNIEQVLTTNDTINMAAVTHFPEFRGLLHKEKRSKPLEEKNVILVENAIGTVLVKGHFLQSWFDYPNFPTDIKLVRPDNPFGKSVSFPASKLLIPDREVMRHMDGYSHALLYRPLPPVRNIKLFSGAKAEIISLKPWKIGLWPMAQFGYRGKGVDFYKQNHDPDDSVLTSLRVDVANQISANALSINLRSSLALINPRYQNAHMYKLTIIILLFSNVNFLRNVPDLAFKTFCRNCNKNSKADYPSLNGKKLLVHNLGAIRGTLIYYRQKFWWLMPRNLHLTYSILYGKISKTLRK